MHWQGVIYNKGSFDKLPASCNFFNTLNNNNSQLFKSHIHTGVKLETTFSTCGRKSVRVSIEYSTYILRRLVCLISDIVY